jgi:hypothetical protein
MATSRRLLVAPETSFRRASGRTPILVVLVAVLIFLPWIRMSAPHYHSLDSADSALSQCNSLVGQAFADAGTLNERRYGAADVCSARRPLTAAAMAVIAVPASVMLTLWCVAWRQRKDDAERTDARG